MLCDKIKDGMPDVILSEGMYHVYAEHTEVELRFQKSDFENLSGQEALLQTTRIITNWSAWGKCYRRSFWEEHQFQFAKGRLAEDMQMIDYVVLAAKTVDMVEPFYYYREREGSIVHSVNVKMLEDLLLNLEEWRTYLNNCDLDPTLIHQIRATHAEELCHGVLAYIYLVDRSKRQELIRKSSQFVAYLAYNPSKECTLIRKSIRLIGMKQTCFLLGIIKKIRLYRK
jgi:hypothetical protein